MPLLVKFEINHITYNNMLKLFLKIIIYGVGFPRIIVYIQRIFKAIIKVDM